MSYPKELLSTRAVVRPGLWAVIPKDGLVNNVIPGIENCRVSIVASPKMGASFVEYVVEAAPGGGTADAWPGEPQVESFLYLIEGDLSASAGGETRALTQGGYLFSPEGEGLSFKNEGASPARLLLYKQRRIPLKGRAAWRVWGNVNDIAPRVYEGMENVSMKDLLPTDPAFDMNMHILSFLPGGCHPIVETHVQEHGAYILSGEGMYFMDDRWMGIQKDDFMWFGPYVPQCAYGVGREPFTYIYSKDCNRDVLL